MSDAFSALESEMKAAKDKATQEKRQRETQQREEKEKQRQTEAERTRTALEPHYSMALSVLDELRNAMFAGESDYFVCFAGSYREPCWTLDHRVEIEAQWDETEGRVIYNNLVTVRLIPNWLGRPTRFRCTNEGVTGRGVVVECGLSRAELQMAIRSLLVKTAAASV